MEKSTIKAELVFKTSRSSGSGGQHVNKVSTKVEVHFHINNSDGLDEDEKSRILSKLKNRITNAGTLIVTCRETRSQFKNKELAINKLFKLLNKGLYVKPIRKIRKMPKSLKEKRLKDKKALSEKKQMRQKVTVV